MTRWKASGIHLSISVLIGLIAFSLLYFVYYPEPYFKVAGADQLIMILLAVDVILGPLLTFSVFKAGKKGMKADLAVISILQIAALTYGLSIMWRVRPMFAVAAIDRIELVYANDLTDADMASAPAAFQKRPMWGPKLIGIRLPTDPAEQMRITDMAMAGGKDVHLLPVYYVSFDSVGEALAKRSKPLTKLAKTAKQRDALAAMLGRKPDLSKERFVPLIGRAGSIALMVDPQSGKPLHGVTMDPW